MRKRKHSTVTKEKATRCTKKLINLLTWFYYVKKAYKIFLFLSDNKDQIYETLHYITDLILP